jgi:predicted PurR-regulated permease PerM
MIQRKSGETEPGNRKIQQAASTALYAVLVILALWVVRDFIPAVVWAAVIAIALWPLLSRLELSHGSRARTTLVALSLTAAVALFVVLPFILVITQAAHETHDFLAWFKQAEANGIPLPDLIGRLPFLLVLFGILGGAQTFGLLGLFIGPALMTVLMVLWRDWVR